MTGAPGPRADLAAATAAALLVVAAVLVGRHLPGHPPHAVRALAAAVRRLEPAPGAGHAGRGPVAGAVVAYGPSVAARPPWRRLLLAAWAAALAWTWSLALVDGWRRGVAGRLTTRNAPSRSSDASPDIPAALRYHLARTS